MASEKKETLKISVIIPVHNGERTLERCLEAIYRSSYPPYEVIVADDASTDRSAEIVGRYPCKLVRLTENVGAARAKNRGAAQATGDVLFFTDADVVIPPHALDVIAKDLADEKVAGVVGLLDADLPYPDFCSQFKNLWMHFTYARLPREVGLFYTSAASLRKHIFEAAGGFDERYRGASVTEDMDFGQRLLTAGHRIWLDKRLSVRHLKHYGFWELLRTDFVRARALMKIWLRNKLARTRRRHFASVPWFFTASVPLAGLLVLGLLLALAWPGWGWALAAASLVGIWALNAPFLLFLGRMRGGRFFWLACLFLPLNLFVSGLGIASAFVDVARGRAY